MAWSKKVRETAKAFNLSRSVKVTCGDRPTNAAIEAFVAQVARALKIDRDWLKWHRNSRKGIIIDLC